jgi:hypothetical protein
MSKPTREAAFSALWTLLQTITPPIGSTWNTKSRRLRLWDKVPVAAQPALFLHKGLEVHSQAHELAMPKYRWTSTVWTYFRVDTVATSDESNVPDVIINNFIDNVEAVLLPTPQGERQTLGNVVYHCFIDGNVATDSGALDNQAVIVIPITIITGF